MLICKVLSCFSWVMLSIGSSFVTQQHKNRDFGIDGKMCHIESSGFSIISKKMWKNGGGGVNFSNGRNNTMVFQRIKLKG